jgi:Leucine-rich repeat (LRR) protein
MESNLDLSHGEIEEFQVVAAQMTEKISFLNLSLNRISCLGDFSLFRSLKRLDLSGNALVSIQGICTLQYLEILSLADNHLETDSFELEPFSTMHNLKRLNVNGNRLSKVPLAICYIPQLTHLGLAENIISHLPAQIEKMTSLRYLSIKNNNIRTSNTGIYHLYVLDFTKMPLLRGLSIVGNPIAETLLNGMLSHISVVQLVDSSLNTPEVPVTRQSMMALSPNRASSLLKMETVKAL